MVWYGTIPVWYQWYGGTTPVDLPYHTLRLANPMAKDDIETFFSGTFFLYREWPADDTCGCAIPRQTLLPLLAASMRELFCPLCGRSGIVSTILDGYTHSIKTNQVEPAERRSPLLFKYGSLSYHVSLPKGNPSGTAKRPLAFLWPLNTHRNGEYLAQAHVAYVLGLELTETKVRL